MDIICSRKSILQVEEYIEKLDRVNVVLSTEDKRIRPLNSVSSPGGLINLRKSIPTIIVPDLHARVDFFSNILEFKFQGNTVLEHLINNTVQIVCVGDGFHSERRGKERWLQATQEFIKGYKKHKFIDEEMLESLTLMEIVIELKINFPRNFHFLKGNHENILNEEGYGNYPFGKFTSEGAMVKAWVEKFYGSEFMDKYYLFEKNMPLFAVGKNFLISHAEPTEVYTKDDIINCYLDTDVIYGLTWTRDNQSEDGSVETMLENFGKDFYFGGHRPVKELYNLRANSKFVQIHNPKKQIIALIKPGREINLEEDIIDIQENGDING